MDMLAMNPVEALLAQTALANTLFAANSRYYGLQPLIYEPIPGKPLVYLPRRFLPQAGNFQTVQEHNIVQGERLDNIAAQYLGDPELFWRLCDANNAMRPQDLTETPGTKLNITLPEGIAGSAL